jgi:RNA polymerase sigma-70 factor (ECF subfamily)
MAIEAQQLLLEAREGDSATLGRLLEQYRNYLRLLARIEIGRKLQGKVDASDLVQEVFLDAHRYFPNFRGTAEPQFVQWLREILAGTLANQVRRYFGTQARDLRLERSIAADLDRSSVALGGIPVDPQPSPSEHVMRGEQSLLVADALSKLPPDYQTVIVLRHLEGLTFPQVAERMERSVDSVEKLWLRGLTQLKKSFGGAL